MRKIKELKGCKKRRYLRFFAKLALENELKIIKAKEVTKLHKNVDSAVLKAFCVLFHIDYRCAKFILLSCCAPNSLFLVAKKGLI